MLSQSLNALCCVLETYGHHSKLFKSVQYNACGAVIMAEPLREFTSVYRPVVVGLLLVVDDVT